MKYNCVRCGTEFEAKHRTSLCANCKTDKCIICGSEFEVKFPYTGKTCSSKCRGIWRKQSGLGKEVAEKAKATIQKKYGLENLRQVQQSKIYKKTCKYCGESFETQNPRQEYCSKDHYGSCPVCGKLVKITQMYIEP